MVIDSALLAAVAEALSKQPQDDGGGALVLATGSGPPAVALLSTGDVLLDGDKIRVGIHATSSAVARLGGSFTLVVPLKRVVARVEVIDAAASIHGDLAKIEGTIASIRPTAEPPWVMKMTFEPMPATDRRVPLYLEYWRSVRAWLSGESPVPPTPPHL